MRLTQLTAPLLLLVVATAVPALASDHLDAPAVMGNGGVDVNDLYAFQSPANPDNTVLILTVNPLAGVASPTTFDPNVQYSFKIDNNGDALADITYTTTFAPAVGGVQALTLVGTNGAGAAGTSDSDVAVTGGGLVRAGLYDDPFFFDLAGFQNGLAFTGTDFFAGANVSAIVLEVPSSSLGGPNLGVWATTSTGGSQVDRVGRPAINTVLIPSARKDEFNFADPSGDFATFGADVNAAVAGLSSQANADALTGILLPDVLTIDTSSSAGFLNGRNLTDDVIDAELTLLTASSSPIGDGVDANDVAFLNVFPYLAAPNIAVPEPASIAFVLVSLAGLVGRRSRS